MILILGGTAEARELAAALHRLGTPVISSLAGRVSSPRLPVGEVRVGGFGGPEAMAQWLSGEGVSAVVDATHPFAERISASAASACGASDVPLLRLQRPGWQERPGDHWHWAGDLAQAAALVPQLGRRVLLSTGRQGLEAFAGIGETWFLIRCVDPPEVALPPRHELLLDRGPYTHTGERALIEGHGIDLVVTKDSGGTHTIAKLDVARELSLPVIVVRRPPTPEGIETVPNVEQALTWASARLG